MNVLLWIRDYVKAHFRIHKDRLKEYQDEKSNSAFTQDARNVIKDINGHSRHKKILWH